MAEKTRGEKTRWKKGQSANPGGRPKLTFSYLKELGEQLNQVDPKDPEGRTNGQIIVSKQIEVAKMGSIRAVNEILDRLLGKPAQSVNLDANMRVLSVEEHVSSILESLEVLKPAGKNAPGDKRIN